MKKALLAIAMLGLTAGSVLAADRLSDRDLKSLVARIEEGRDRFDDALDNDVKRSIHRDGTSEAKVSDYLNDFQENIDRLEERLKPDYAASAEAATLLRQATSIDAAFRQRAPGMKGQSEWNRLATDLRALAAAYGTSFPVPDGARIRRIGDGELADAADDIARGASQLKKALDNELKKDPSVTKEMRQGITAEADNLSKDAKALRSLVKDGEPSSAEADRLLARTAKLQATISGRNLSDAATAMSGLRPAIDTVASAYGVQFGGT
jgi:hypothetical protein